MSIFWMAVGSMAVAIVAGSVAGFVLGWFVLAVGRTR